MLVHCIEKLLVVKKINIKIIMLNSSSLVAGHQVCFCVFLLIGVSSELVGLVDSWETRFNCAGTSLENS